MPHKTTPFRVNADSVERALEHHRREGRIKSFRVHPDGGYVVDIHLWGYERLKTTREAHIFVTGLAAVVYAERAKARVHN